MKIYFYFIGIFFMLVLVECERPPEIKKIFDECTKEVKVIAASQQLSDRKKISSCFHACAIKKHGFMVDGKIVVEKAIEVALKYEPETVVDSIKAAALECANKANEMTDECDVGGLYEKCYTEKVHPH